MDANDRKPNFNWLKLEKQMSWKVCEQIWLQTQLESGSDDVTRIQMLAVLLLRWFHAQALIVVPFSTARGFRHMSHNPTLSLLVGFSINLVPSHWIELDHMPIPVTSRWNPYVDLCLD